MKKILLALVLSVAALSAHAEDSFVQAQYAFRDTISGDSGNPNRQGLNFIVGTKVYPGVTVDLNSQFRTERLNSDSGTSSQRLEVGATYVQDITQDVAAYVRGGLGEKFASADDFLYYSIEGGAKAKLTSELVGKVGYRYRDAFNSAKNDQTNTLRVGVEYSLNKTNVITAGIDRSYGDSEFIGYNAGYVVKF